MDADIDLIKHLERGKSRLLQNMLSAFAIYLSVLVVGVLIFISTFTLVHVCGSSMLPTLEHHSFGLSMGARNVSAGQIIILRMTPQNVGGEAVTPHMIKRIVAVGGDEVVFRHGIGTESDYIFLYINGEREIRPDGVENIRRSGEGNYGHIMHVFNIGQTREIPMGHIMVLSDNRNASTTDSRREGFYPLSRVTGRFVHGFQKGSSMETFVRILFMRSRVCQDCGY